MVSSGGVFGSFHIHSRTPPSHLSGVGGTIYEEWFNGVELLPAEKSRTTVIFIYRNPLDVIYSRFQDPDHLAHIEVDPSIALKDLAESGQDLYGISEFFDNYTASGSERDYDILCVKYETFFDRLAEFNVALGLRDDPSLYPVRRERTHVQEHSEELQQIYRGLINKMQTMPTLHINAAKNP